MTTSTLFTSRIIKATALIADTKLLLAHWNLAASVEDNFAAVRQGNVFGKASRSRVEDILVIFRQRYFDNPAIGRALVMWAQANVPSQWLDPLLYFYSVQNDATLHAIVLDVLLPLWQTGQQRVYSDKVTAVIKTWVAQGKTTTAWGDETVLRVTRNALATLRDFQILKGKVNKTLTPPAVPIESFAWLAFDLKQRVGAGEALVHSPEWGLFFLNTTSVERLLVEAHQHHYLNYDTVGRVTRVDFSCDSSLEAYAQFLLARK